MRAFRRKARVNGPRYIHTHRKVAQNRYVPTPDTETPLALWKRRGMVGDVIPEADKARVAREGRIDLPDYEARGRARREPTPAHAPSRPARSAAAAVREMLGAASKTGARMIVTPP
ncbi:hypothetical protein [uncultured Methylobacterium sp.]|uniref:hypothetical protein n=1 Tax=uncultured Methylobacterium sp. TaxID=157278 RepID=UPI0035C9B7C7